MAVARRAIVLNGGNLSALSSADYLLGAGDVWSGTTQYQAGQTRQYIISGTTDANGRITCFPTTTGIATGVALFSSILAYSCIATTGSTSAGNNPYFERESTSVDLRTIVFRGIVFPTVFLSIGINFSPAAFAGSGLGASIMLTGLP